MLSAFCLIFASGCGLTDFSRQENSLNKSTYVLESCWGGYGTAEGQFQSPRGISIDSANNIYVADSSNRCVQKFDPQGNFILKWGTISSTGGKISFPYGISIDTYDNIYITDPPNCCVQKFDSQGNFILKWGSNGTTEGKFKYPCGISNDSANNIYVVDSTNHRVQKFDSCGNFILKWGSYGSAEGQFKYPQGINIDSSDNVYVLDYSNYRIQKFDSSGTCLQVFGNSSQLLDPCFCAVDSAGVVYVGDGNEVKKYNLGGAYISSLTCSNDAIGIAFDSNNGIFIAQTLFYNSEDKAILKYKEIR